MTTLKADYGIDAPMAVRNLTIWGAIAFIAGFVFHRTMVPARPVAGTILLIAGFVSAFCLLLAAGLLVWSSKFGKLIQRERLIDALRLGGNENVLDVGCGRGLLLIGVARRLPNGKAFGIDLWQKIDQSGNNPEATLANAKAENVVGRVEVRTADMRSLPFPDESMDAVISSIAIHNVPNEDGRAQAIREIARVLKSKGRIAIQDFHATGEYAKTLRNLGWKDVELSRANFWIFPPVRIATGRKP
jgi:SAM-dependent methyltransferase